MKIAYFYTDDWEKEYVTACLPKDDITFLPGIINDYATLDQDTQAVVVFICSRVDTAVLNRLPQLKLIITRSVGFNHIDVAAAQARGITVCNVPGYATYAVAEYTWALALALSRKVCEASKRLQHGSFSRQGLMGFDMRGKTLGIVGVGNIGVQVGRIAQCFDMKVLAYDVHVDKVRAQQLGITYVSLEQLLAQSDIVSMHVAYNAKTHHMINRENINKFKHGACLINTARGAVIQTEALVQGLDSGILAGVALDVLEEEFWLAHETQAVLGDRSVDELRRLVASHYLLNHPHVIITPHNAFNSIEARRQCLDITVENIKAWMNDKAINVVS